MNFFSKLLVASALFVGAAPFALADQIQLTGNMSISGSSVTFDNTQSGVNGTSTGIFAPFQSGNVGGINNTAVTFQNFTYTPNPSTSGGKGQLLFTGIASASSGVAAGINFEPGAVVKFYMTTEAYTSSPAKTATFTNYELSGIGTFMITYNGVTQNYTGTYDLTSQGQNGNTTNLSFSDFQATTAAATPEPSSLMLLGTGLLSAAGVALRKRKLA